MAFGWQAANSVQDEGNPGRICISHRHPSCVFLFLLRLNLESIVKSILYAAVAIGLIGFGAYRELYQNRPSAEDQARCESIVREIYGSNPDSVEQLASSCNEVGMVAMMDARTGSAGAQEAAQTIGSANQNSLISTLINCALIGAGIGALGAAFVATRRKA